jgi:hypothetical protein
MKSKILAIIVSMLKHEFYKTNSILLIIENAAPINSEYILIKLGTVICVLTKVKMMII